MNVFDAYVDVGQYPEVIELFERVQSSLMGAPMPRVTHGFDKDLPKRLEKWKRSRRDNAKRKAHSRHA